MKIETIAFDADDTLWHNEVHFQEAQEKLEQLLSPWLGSATIKDKLFQIEIKNLPKYGYGIKAYVLSMLEAAIQVSNGEIQADAIDIILSIGCSMLEAEVSLCPHVTETIITLSQKHRLMVITKGDLLEQNTKVTRSGLTPFFSLVEVVSEKTPAVYSDILKKYHLNPETFLMVGNSLRSDILPILALGGNAVHIPADTTWEHEMVSDFDTSQDGYHHLEHMGQLPDLIKIS